MADIVVDTYKLNQYAQRLSTVNRRITQLDNRMCTLYGKVGLQGLFDLMQAKVLTGYSWRLLRCQVYLNQTASDFEKVERNLGNEDPLSFEKSIFSGIKEVIFDVGVAVKKGAEKVKNIFEKAIVDALTSYYSHGKVYEIVQYGKAVLTAVKGVAKIAGGVASLFGTGGMSSPVAILAITSGINDVWNSIFDATYTYTGDYDKIGQNMLKDKLVEGGKTLGSAFGNEKIGELFGNATYYGIDIVTSLAALQLSMDKIKQLSSTNMGKMVGEVKEIANLDVSKLLTTDLETLRYQTKLAGYTFKETSNFISNVGALMKVGGNAVNVGRGLNDIYTSYDKDFENPVLNTIDKISTVKNLVKGSFDLATWDFAETATAAKQVDSIFVFKRNKSFLNSEIFYSKSFSTFKDNIDGLKSTFESTVKSGKKVFE